MVYKHRSMHKQPRLNHPLWTQSVVTWAVVVSAGVLAPPHAQASGQPDLPTLKTWVQQEKQVLQTFLKYPLKTPVVVYRAAFPPPSDPRPDDPAHASRWNDSGQPWPDGCEVTVFNVGVTFDEPELRSILAHETYHCFQDEWIGSYTTWKAMPSWVMEGSARWVGEVLHPTKKQGFEANWEDYFQHPERSLFHRKFDAIGFFGHLQDVAGAGAVWERLRPMVVAAAKGGSSAAYLAALGNHKAPFVNSWASSYFREPAFGPAWDALGPGGMSPVAPLIKQWTFSNGSSADLTAAPYTVADARFNSLADVLTITATGSVRIATGKFDHMVTDSVSICTSRKTCTCPGDAAPDTDLVLVKDTTAASLPRIAVTGDVTGAGAHAEGQSLDDYCQSRHTYPINCGLLKPADFTQVGVRGAGPPHINPAYYCVYAGQSGATGGIELDVFVDPNPGEAAATYGRGRQELDQVAAAPANLPGIDQGEIFGRSGVPSSLIARRGTFTFVITIPGSDNAPEQLLRLGRLVLKRATR
jgi:hypothetical protein